MRIRRFAPLVLMLGALPYGSASAATDAQHDFDFEIGSWKTHVKLLKAPLSGSHEWIELDGTSIVRKLSNGRANLVELDVAGGSLRIEGISLRLYEPGTKRWSLNYATSSPAR